MPTRPLRHGLPAAGFKVFALALLLSASPQSIDAALAQQNQAAAQRSFSIPAGPLSSALVAFGQQAGIQVSYVPSVAAGRTSPGVSGTMSRNAALARLLSGTGLTFQSTGANTVVVSNAGGNDATATVEGAIALDTIDVSGGASDGMTADTPYRTPGTSAYISAEQIERIPPSRPGDVFNNTPGVIAASKNTGGSVDVNIRGLQGMNRVKVMVDGTQQESSTYRSYNGTDNRSYFDPDLLSGVEIEKGPGDGPYGSGAMGGVVNMKTITPRDILLPGQSYGVRVRGSIGDNAIAPRFDPPGARPPDEAPDFLDIGDNRSGSIAAAATSERFDFVAAVSKRQHGNYFAGKYGKELHEAGLDWRGNPKPPVRYSLNLPREEVPNTSEDTTSTLLKGTLKYGDHSLELGYMRQDSEFGYSFPLWAQQASRQQFFLSPTESNRYTAKYKYQPQDNDLIDWHVNVWATDLSTKEPEQRIVGMWRSLLDTKAHGGEAWNTSKFRTPLGLATVSYGAEYSTTDFSGSGKDANAAPFLKTRGSRELFGTFLRSELDVTDWLELHTGVRYDTYRTEGAAGTTGYITGTGGELIGNEGDAVLPSFGVTVTPWAGIQLFGKYAKGYRPPAIREIAGTAGEGSGWIEPNPYLKPEQSENWEFGVNVLKDGFLSAGDKLRLKAAYFDNRYSDYILPGSPYYGMSVCPIGTATSACFQNVKTALFKGYEVSGQYDVGMFFATASFNYYTEAEVGSDPDNLLLEFGMGYVPPEIAATGTFGVRLLGEKLTLGTRINYVGRRAAPYMDGTTYSTVRFTPHVTTIGLFGSYEVNNNITANFSVENLTDQYYLDPLAVTAIPSPGRTARVGFEMKLGEPGSVDDTGITLPEITTPASGYNWAGAFLGLEGGYAVGDASAQGDLAGTMRTGSSPNYVWVPYTSATNTVHDPAALTGSIFAGYNLQLNSPVVIGIDASIGYAHPIFKNEQFTSPVAGRSALTTNVSSSMEWGAAVRSRIGVAFDRTMPYITGGLSIAGLSYNYTSFSGVGSASITTLPDPMRLRGTYVGWTLGAGIEHAMTDHVILRAEYLHSDFGKETFDTPYGAHEVDLSSNEWKLGVAYKF